MSNDVEIVAKGVTRGGVLMHRPIDALALVDACSARGKPVLGLDAFRLTTTTTTPSLVDSLDLSSQSRSHERAAAHLKGYLHDDIWFEVVI